MTESNPTIDESDIDCDMRSVLALRRDDDLDMTSMVDVTFLLLVFFMVTASFSIQRSIPMPRQFSDEASVKPSDETPESSSVFVEIDGYGGFLVRTDAWEKSTVGKQNLTSLLRDAIGDVKDRTDTTTPIAGKMIEVTVDGQANLQSMIDGIDASTSVGFASIQVHQNEL